MYSEYYNKYYYGDGLNASKANVKANSAMLNKLAYNVYSYPDTEQLIGLDGKLNPNATLGRTITGAGGKSYYVTPDDWTDAVFQNSLRQEYNVNASGGSDRITARLKADYQIKKWLKLGANIGFVHSTQTANANLGTSLSFTSSMAPIYPLYLRQIDENGNVYIPTD